MAALTLPRGRRELEAVAVRALSRAKTAAAKAKQYAENVMETGVALGAAAGIGYWLGRPGADQQYFGIDAELLIGIPLAGYGIIGRGNMARTARAAGTGVLAAWAFNAAGAKAAEG